MGTAIGICAAVAFVFGIFMFVYKQGRDNAKYKIISQEVKKREKQEQYAKKIKRNINNLSVDSVRGRLRKIKR